MKKVEKQVTKTAIGTIVSGIVFLTLMRLLGYERAELLAFSLLIGLSIAALK